MSWVPLYNQTLEPDPSSLEYLRVSIDNVEATRLAIVTSAPSAKPSWFLAFRLTVLATLPDFPGAPLPVQLQKQDISLGKNHLIDFSALNPPYSLILDIPFWFDAITVAIWQEVGELLNVPARITLEVSEIGQTLFALPFEPARLELSEFYVNGIKASYPSEYVINNMQLSWLSPLILEPGDELELIY